MRWRAEQRKELEQLCRYITRPAIANERLKLNRAGQVVLQLKSPYKDGTTHIVMEPLDFMERLAALVPRPRLHLIRFHGVLAPNAKLRSKIIPTPPERTPETASDHAHAQGAPARLSWARLHKRVFDIDIEHCPNCGGALKIIACPEPRRRAAIEDPPVIIKILSHLGLPTRAPPRAPARESIYSKRSEEQKTTCQRKPTAPLALSSSERLHKEPFAHLPTALRPSRLVQQWVFYQAEKELTSLPVLRYGSGHRKRWFKNPIHCLSRISTGVSVSAALIFSLQSSHVKISVVTSAYHGV